MQDEYKKALDFSNYRQTLSIQRKTLKEKIDSKLTYGASGGIFKIDRSLITFVELLIQKDRKTGVVLLDANENPILIEDLEKFRDEIFDRYFTASNEYYQLFQDLKKSRSVEKILEK